MKVCVDEKELKHFKEMQDEGRTRSLTITTYPNLVTDIVVELTYQKDK